jgi:hypothetical protein
MAEHRGRLYDLTGEKAGTCSTAPSSVTSFRSHKPFFPVTLRG